MNPNDNPCYNCPDGPSDMSECEFCPHGQGELSEEEYSCDLE